MVGQRRREPRGDTGRRDRGRARLGLLGVILIAAASVACPLDGRPIGGPGAPGIATGGGAGTGPGSASLIGTWRNFTTFFDGSSGDTIVSETRWRFEASGACFKVVTRTFVRAGVQDTTFQSGCTFVSGGSAITITFTGSSVATTFSVAFSSGDLLLDGFRFQRIG
jgi:hypothetical protein